jgi:adenylate kinase family enzyme
VTSRPIAVIGLPGSGKSTLIRAVTSRVRGEIFAVGALLRHEASRGDRAAAALPERGAPMTVEDFERSLRTWLRHTPGSGPVILDGSPRNRAQADCLATFEDFSNLIVVILQLQRETATSRLRERMRTARSDRRRHDDHYVAIAVRIARQEIDLTETAFRCGQFWTDMTP